MCLCTCVVIVWLVLCVVCHGLWCFVGDDCDVVLCVYEMCVYMCVIVDCMLACVVC